MITGYENNLIFVYIFARAKLDRPDVFAPAPLREQLAALENGTGRTYFDRILDVFAGHPEVTLVLR